MLGSLTFDNIVTEDLYSYKPTNTLIGGGRVVFFQETNTSSIKFPTFNLTVQNS